MIERLFFKIEKIPFLWQALSWSFLKYMDEKNEVIIGKDNLSWLVKQVTGLKLDIGLDKYDYLEELMDYDLTHYKSNDIVLIIGAGAGLGAILAATTCMKVYAVEPLLYDILKKNVRQSSVKDKITVFTHAFGKNGEVTCEYWGEKKSVKSKDLSTLLSELKPSPTVIKCDCEGCEFGGFSGCEDYKNVRLIELEYHTNSEQELKKLIDHFRSHDFSVHLRKKVPIPKYKHIGVLYARR